MSTVPDEERFIFNEPVGLVSIDLIGLDKSIIDLMPEATTEGEVATTRLPRDVQGGMRRGGLAREMFNQGTVGPIVEQAVAAVAGNWQIDALHLPLPGTWSVTVEANTGTFTLLKFEGAIDVGQ